MNNNEQFFRVARLHTDLSHIDALLRDLGRTFARTKGDGDLAYGSERSPFDDEGRSGERAAMREREGELLELRENAVRELLPQYFRLAELEINRLDNVMESENKDVLSDQFVAVFDAVLSAYVHRLVSAFDTWNDTIEPLIQFSEGLPANDEHEIPSKAGHVVRRIGPNARGKYTGIEVFGRRLELIDVEVETEKFFSTLESALLRLLNQGREQVRTETSSRDGY